MSDNKLTKLMGRVPSRFVESHSIISCFISCRRCILLLEDLDAAFTRGVSRDDKSTGTPVTPVASISGSKKDSDNDGESTLSLSGLLNSLDGVAAAEGR